MYELFLKDVLRDITQKAGQKCTAIRRVLVPREMLSSLKEDLVEMLGATKVGDPADEETRMGPLASAAQLKDVISGIERLETEASRIAGKPGRLSEKGFFVSPSLFEIAGDGKVVHEHEVFGPVASLLPYSENPAEIVARGNGGLVCSVYSEDSAFLAETVAGIAPWHGRIFLGHPKIELSPGPGTVLPQLVHGGPGRAGGGEELGGRRALQFYLQRVALEGSRPVIQGLTKGGAA
jgi:oxepin-CoA hydrolase/3-oxo-5,6-dehydrosuberyl-CoA semialdehyde dehydrogenase